MPRIAVLLLVLIVAGGCAVRRPYEPRAPEAAKLKQQDSAFFAEHAYDAEWWRHFDDPVLEGLERAALQSNHDVRTAVARVDQARAIFDEIGRDRYPIVGASASVDRREQAVPGFSTEPISTTTYRAGFDAFWEIDLFGRVRSAVRAAAATAESFDATLDDVRVSVAAEVARAYFELR
jgi:multidrug efflux system outer membrane protein